MRESSRRHFLTTVGISAVAVPINALLFNDVGHAQEAPKLDEGDPQAQALGYVHQSDNPEQLCKGCQLYQGEADAEWGPCVIFPGKTVNANGWCRSWVVKPG